MLVSITSACGAASGLIDDEDFDRNPWGFICCSQCEAIVDARNSWVEVYA